MKHFSLTTLLISFIACASYAQNNTLNFNDTRNLNDSASNFKFNVRFDFKLRNTVGVPGTGLCSGMMTVAPWADSTGGKIHQLNFNNGGIFYRQGLQQGSWDSWRKILIDSGNQSIKGALTLTYDDRPLSFISTKNNSWQYIEYYDPTGRRAWIGMDPSNNFNIVRENGGNILFLGANVGIGTAKTSGYRLAVEGTISARRIKVTQESWADFVFQDNYRPLSPKEIALFIQKNKHLPGIPSAMEVEREGLDIGDMNKKLLQKIEELTLYIIEQDKKIDAVVEELDNLKSKGKK